ncbi:hypothetical protein FRB93_011365 [Tulasnella sp. JGI-2019a]|nr:hypothetical protein FRB93_011365 [Tulasnella sp. JGI-2019a]
MASKQETDTTEPTLRPVPGEPPALQTVQKQPGSDISNNASRLHTTGDSDTMLPHRQRVTPSLEILSTSGMLLLALQRLGPAGYRELSFGKDKAITLPTSGAKFTLEDPIARHYGISGRATSMYVVTSSSLDPRPILDGEAHPSIGELSNSTGGIRNLTLDGNNGRNMLRV